MEVMQNVFRAVLISIKCYKTKTGVIILANHKDTGNPVNQSKLTVNTVAGTKHKKMCVTKSQ